MRWEVVKEGEQAWAFVCQDVLDIERLDFDGDGCVGQDGFARLSELWGQCVEKQP